MASDGLKPQYDGMSAYEVVEKVVKAYDTAVKTQMVEEIEREVQDFDNHDCRQESCGVCIKERPEYAV